MHSLGLVAPLRRVTQSLRVRSAKPQTCGSSASLDRFVGVLMGGAGTEYCPQMQKDDLHGVGRVMHFQDPAAAPAAATTTAAAAATLRQAVASVANDRSIRRITDAVDAARVSARVPLPHAAHRGGVSRHPLAASAPAVQQPATCNPKHDSICNQQLWVYACLKASKTA
jgi:hypothetical protein